MKYVKLTKLLKEKGLSRSMVYSLIKKGLPYYQPGRNIYVDLDEFDEFFQRFKKHEDRPAKYRNLDALIQASMAECGLS